MKTEATMNCIWCRKALGGFDRVTLDHLIPKSRGGTNHDANLALSCQKCNFARKSKSIPGWWRDCRARGLQPDTDLLLQKLRLYIDTPGIPKRCRVTAGRQLKSLEGQATSL